MINNYLKNKKCYLICLTILVMHTYSFAGIHNSNIRRQIILQADTIAGTILDNNGQPVKNVAIINETEHLKTKTSRSGTFVLTGKIGDRLSFDHPDFYHQELTWKGKQKFIVTLAGRYLPPLIIDVDPKDTGLVEEASVDILHGRQLKSNLLQSVGTVGTNQLTSTPASQFLQALPGRITGLNIGFTAGGPGLDGTGLSYNIRSARTANPTILIDGVERPFLSIDPEEIESVSVLKDALSTVMYGMRSSNGIISITTKKGDRGTPRISFSAQTAIETPTALPKTLPAGQFATLYDEAQQNDAGTATITPRYSAADIAAYNNGTDPYGHPNVDWYKTVLKNTSTLKKYNFNLQGSGTGFRYFVDLDNLTETGLLNTLDTNKYNTNAQLDRYLIRTNLGVDVTKTTTMQLNLFGRIQTLNEPGGGTAANPAAGTAAILSALATTPRNAYPVLNPDGSLGGTSLYGQDVNIYGQAVERGYVVQNARDMAVDLQVTQKLDVLLPGLYLKGQGSYNNSTTYATVRAKDFAVFQYNPTTTAYSKIGATSAQGQTGTPGSRSRVVYVEGDLGYKKSFGKNNLSILALADQQGTLVYDAGTLPAYYTDYAARITYNYDQKYLLEGAGSYAGYNYFAPDKRYAKYWAAGAGWNIYKENFIKDNFKLISNLKLRGTYGLTGSANTGYYSYIQTYWTPSSNTSNNDGYYFGTNGVTRSTGQNALAANVGPEKAKKLDLGLDLGLWNNQLTFTGEYFKNHFYDLVAAPGTETLLLGVGTAYPSENVQIFDYSGAEFTLGWQSHAKNFNYFINGNFSLVQSKVVFNDEVPKKYDYQRSTGKQVGMPFGYTAIGLYQSYAEINDPSTAVLASTPKATLRPGDIRYLDRNGDGVINSDDQGPIGNGLPTIYFGINAGFNYKGFDVSVLFQGTRNRQSYLNGDFWNGFGNGGNNNAYEFNLNRWTPQNPSTIDTRLSVGTNVNNTQTSSFWMRNTDFVRLKNAEVGYTLPSALTRKIGVPSVRVFMNGLNLITWSQLFKIRKDIDPESLYTGSTYPYPILRTINFGINAKF